MKVVTIEEAIKAVCVLNAYGATRFQDRTETTQGQRIGMAVASVTEQIIDTSIAMLEDGNHHVAAGILRAMYKGQGTFARDGSKVEIELPTHFDSV